VTIKHSIVIKLFFSLSLLMWQNMAVLVHVDLLNSSLLFVGKRGRAQRYSTLATFTLTLSSWPYPHVIIGLVAPSSNTSAYLIQHQ
jgi:hypothetical protein